MFFSLLLAATNNAFTQTGIARTIIVLAVLVFIMAWFREVRQVRAFPFSMWFIEAWRAIRFGWALGIAAICTLSILLSIWVVFLIANVLYYVVYLHF